VSSVLMSIGRLGMLDLENERPTLDHVGWMDGRDSHAADGARFPLECLFLIEPSWDNIPGDLKTILAALYLSKHIIYISTPYDQI
jgi:hypothetical protein